MEKNNLSTLENTFFNKLYSSPKASLFDIFKVLDNSFLYEMLYEQNKYYINIVFNYYNESEFQKHYSEWYLKTKKVPDNYYITLNHFKKLTLIK